MVYNDKNIFDVFTRSDGRMNNYLCNWSNLLRKDIDLYNYISNRYDDIDDNDTVSEILYRIKHGIDKKPKCPICGLTKNMFNKSHYKTYCSEKCEYSEEGNKQILEKRKLTNIEKFGDLFPLKVESIKEKLKQTNIAKYGAVSPMLNKEILNKAKQTCLEKYGVDRYSKTDECREKYKQTCLEKYGVDNLIKLKKTQDKIKQTYLRKYGVDHWFKCDEFREKAFETMKKNRTLRYSKIEILFYDYLVSLYGTNDVILLYKNEKYPYRCDFYIKSLDLYIELNGTWTHGLHPYDETCLEDIDKLNFWKSKNSTYYNSAINTWTVLDVNKRNIAKKNGLNFLEIYSINIKKCKEIYSEYISHLF